MNYGVLRRALLACSPLVACAALSCSTGTKEQAAKTALNAMGTDERHESFEATARVLDEHPEMVDEVYAIIRKHDATLNRVLENSMRDLKEPALSVPVADLVSQHPDSLAETLTRTTEAVIRRPDARKAMSRAVAAKAPELVDILTDDPEALSKVLTATLIALEKKPAARTAALAAVRKNRGRMVALVKNDKELAKEMTEELLREMVEDKPTIEKLLRASGIIDDDAKEKKTKKK